VIGTIVGGYRVVTELGRGPTGLVYYAEHPVIGRRAAIKVLAPEFSEDSRLDRFLTHLKVASGIRHPNIVDVLDVGRMPGGVGAIPPQPTADVTFVVMEMLEGESLDERLEREETLDEDAVARLLVQVASAVGAAHERGLAHAALKPANIFITNSVDYPDFVKVLDFGAAMLRPEGDASLTPYLAPEHSAGTPGSPGADIYAVGVLAYEMLAGSPPWPSERAAADGEARRPPMPLHERRAGVSRGLSDVVMRALVPDPDDRWPDMRTFRRAIEKLHAATPAGAAVSNVTRTYLPQPARVLSEVEVERTERVQAKKVGKALSTIIVRRINENRLQLPSMPLVALKALDVLRDPNVTFAELARVIEQDPVIAARVLRVVNSAAYARRDPVTRLEQAVSQIGVKPMRILLVELAACQVFTSRSPGIRQMFQQIWDHCLAVACLSRDLATRLTTRVEPDVAYLAGLLHDIGKPIVAGLLLEAERKLIEDLDIPWMTETLWKKTVAESHRGVGASVATTWNLPAAIAEAILRCDAYDPNEGPHALGNLVRFANTLAKREGIYVGDVPGDEIVAAILQGRSVLGVDEATEVALTTTLRDRMGTVEGTRTHRNRITDRSRRARFA